MKENQSPIMQTKLKFRFKLNHRAQRWSSCLYRPVKPRGTVFSEGQLTCLKVHNFSFLKGCRWFLFFLSSLILSSLHLNPFTALLTQLSLQCPSELITALWLSPCLHCCSALFVVETRQRFGAGQTDGRSHCQSQAEPANHIQSIICQPAFHCLIRVIFMWYLIKGEQVQDQIW